MADQKHNEKITYDLRRAACRLGASAMDLFDVYARAEEEAGRDPGPAPDLLPWNASQLRRAAKRLAVSAMSMEMTMNRHAREKVRK
jgi:hypothetical protein